MSCYQFIVTLAEHPVAYCHAKADKEVKAARSSQHHATHAGCEASLTTTTNCGLCGRK